jgi:hypothetical protein
VTQSIADAFGALARREALPANRGNYRLARAVRLDLTFEGIMHIQTADGEKLDLSPEHLRELESRLVNYGK